MPRMRITGTVVLTLGLACGGDPQAEGSAGTEVATGDSTGPDVPTSAETGVGSCVDGEVKCTRGVAQVCAGGVFEGTEACPGACVDGVGCVSCEPGLPVCDYVGASVVVETAGAHLLVADQPTGVSVLGLQSVPPVASYGCSGAWQL